MEKVAAGSVYCMNFLLGADGGKTKFTFPVQISASCHSLAL
jgi:hypothetical protein